MTDEAFFRRTATPSGVRFDVTPAEEFKSADLAIAKSTFTLIGFVVYALGALLAFAFLARIFGPIMGFVVTCLGGGWLIFHRRGKDVGKRSAPERRPVSISIDASGMTWDGGQVPADDIAELVVRHPSDRGGERPDRLAGPFAYEGVNRAAYNRGAKLRAELNNRAYALMLRRRSISTPETIAFGLTWNAGEALRDDLLAAIREFGGMAPRA